MLLPKTVVIFAEFIRHISFGNFHSISLDLQRELKVKPDDLEIIWRLLLNCGPFRWIRGHSCNICPWAEWLGFLWHHLFVLCHRVALETICLDLRRLLCTLKKCKNFPASDTSRLNSLFALRSTRKPLLTSLQRVQAASETRVFPLSANRFSPSKWCVCACVRACQTDAKRGILRVTQERSCACVWWLNIDVIMHWDRQPLPVWYRHGYNTETRCCKYSYFPVS